MRSFGRDGAGCAKSPAEDEHRNEGFVLTGGGAETDVRPARWDADVEIAPVRYEIDFDELRPECRPDWACVRVGNCRDHSGRGGCSDSIAFAFAEKPSGFCGALVWLL